MLTIEIFINHNNKKATDFALQHNTNDLSVNADSGDHLIQSLNL